MDADRRRLRKPKATPEQLSEMPVAMGNVAWQNGAEHAVPAIAESE